MNNIPTIIPKFVKPTIFKERTTRNSPGLIEKLVTSDPSSENSKIQLNESEVFHWKLTN